MNRRNVKDSIDVIAEAWKREFTGRPSVIHRNQDPVGTSPTILGDDRARLEEAPVKKSQQDMAILRPLTIHVASPCAGPNRMTTRQLATRFAHLCKAITQRQDRGRGTRTRESDTGRPRFTDRRHQLTSARPRDSRRSRCRGADAGNASCSSGLSKDQQDHLERSLRLLLQHLQACWASNSGPATSGTPLPEKVLDGPSKRSAIHRRPASPTSRPRQLAVATRGSRRPPDSLRKSTKPSAGLAPTDHLDQILFE